MAVLLNASNAVTVTSNPVPAVTGDGALTVNCAAAPGLTAIVLLVPLMSELTVSVAVIV